MISYSGLGRKESLHGVIAKRPLSPPLRSDINWLRFSPNGPPGEAMVEEREQENATLILKVDGGKSTQQPAVDRTT